MPILIAIAALAAISIGAVMMRQRRQRARPGRARLAEGELAHVERSEANDEEGACLDGDASRSPLAVFGAARRGRRGACRPTSGASCRRRPPTAEQFQRLKRGGVDSIRIPISWGAVQPAKGGAPDWSGVDPLVDGAAPAGIEVLPFVYRRPALGGAGGAGSRGGVQGAEDAAGEAGAQRSAWAGFLKLAVARYGPNGTFWAANPDRAQAADPHLADLERGELQILRRPAQPGRIRKAGASSPTRRSRASTPGAKIVLGGLFARPKEAQKKVKPPQAYFATDFLEQMYEKTPGIKSKFNGIALHPYT